ncbi:hypothetical protein E3N88_12028 [Mikania micrantha]|uniref:Uncharacterized protein n=1 Tax=Mikania micrantha TaxID=192012 RepID=A0A5N6P4G7_9ASTR|nr:hypothetical protein E3N88_12028 [Mikania micrantha]
MSSSSKPYVAIPCFHFSGAPKPATTDENDDDYVPSTWRTSITTKPQSHFKPISTPQSPTLIHFSHPASPLKTKVDKGKAPIGSSLEYIPEYHPIDVDLLQSQVFKTEQDSVKKD